MSSIFRVDFGGTVDHLCLENRVQIASVACRVQLGQHATLTIMVTVALVHLRDYAMDGGIRGVVARVAVASRLVVANFGQQVVAGRYG